MSFIGNLFTELWQKIAHVSSTLWAAIEPLLSQDVSNVLTQILPIVTTIVTSLETSGQTGEQKRAAAITQIGSALETAGISAASSIVNTAIELAVQGLPATSPTATDTAANS